MKVESDLNILIIENRAHPNPVLHRWVKSLSVQKTVKCNGIEALMWLGRGNLPGLILAEAEMELMPGTHFIEYIKASGFFYDIPVVAFGEPTSREIIAAMMQAGASDYILKPFSLDQLENRLGRFVMEQAENQ